MSTIVTRYLAICAIIGGMLQILYQIGFDILGKTSTEVINNNLEWTHEDAAIAVGIGTVSLLGSLLFLLGFSSFLAHAYQKKPSKNTVASFTAMFIGTALGTCLNWYFAFVEPMLLIYAREVVIPVRSPFIEGETVSFILMALTALYFGINMIVLRAIPLISAILFTAYPLAGFAPGGEYFGQAILGIAIIWAGLAVYRTKESKIVLQTEPNLDT